LRKTASDCAVFNRAGRVTNSPVRISASLPLKRARQLAREWQLDGEIRGLTAKSLRERKDVLDKLFWLAEREEWTEIGPAETGAFLSHVRAGHLEPGGRWGAAARDARLLKAPSAATLMAYYRQLRCFGNWLLEEGATVESPLGNRKPPLARQHEIQPFSPAQVEALLAAAQRSVHPQRNAALLLFLVDTGARAQEVCGLDVGDLDLSSRRAILRQTKGAKIRSVFFGKRTARALYGLLAPRVESEADEPVFLSDRGTEAGTRLTTSGLGQLFERLGKSAGLTGVRCSPHTARHYYATQFLKNGGSLFSLQAALGHSSLAMVRRYAHLAEADLERQAKAFSPADRLGKR